MKKVYCIEEDKIYDGKIHVMEEWGLKDMLIYINCAHIVQM